MSELQTDRGQDVRKLAHLLDEAFRVPGTDFRFGVDALAGLIPWVGDAAGLVLSAVVISKGIHMGARGATIVRMFVNAALDALVGSIPVVGTVADFFIKANSRNVKLLEKHSLDADRTRTQSRWVVILTILAVLAVIALVVGGAIAIVVWLFSLLF